MDGIFFLVLAFLTIFMSIKLSYYGDVLGKQTKVGSAFVGGLLIASITSLPELVTCISAVAFDNLELSFGDIVGSDMFNIFVLAVYNIYFFKSDVFKNTSKRYILECIILITDYIFISLGTNNIFINITTIILFFAYMIYMLSVILIKTKDEEEDTKKEKFIVLKFTTTAIMMIILSVFLTYQADKISHLYPKFSSSSIGAILLGITTSLPEVVTTFELLKLNNFDMAISNMLGSNIFNFLVLGFADIIAKNSYIYQYSDSYSSMYLYGGLIITILFMLTLVKKFNSKFYYILISTVMILIYFRVWYLQFV